jgi:CheY-like chemotaxis protein
MKRVAIVEDNEDNRLLVEVMLEDAYELRFYEDAASALDGLAGNVPDLILIDISLPGMDGVTLLSRMRERQELKALPAIALTAHAMAGDRERYLAHGFNGYVAKPIESSKTLIAAIEALL